MCGVAGFIQREPASSGAIEAMLDRLSHRGPDGVGAWSGEALGWHVALGHRRLSILDLVSGGQPKANEDEKIWITFNGEIYNHAALRSRLIARGHRFRTRSDTEAIVHQYEEHGPSGFRELNGMFAFAIWDGRTRTLTLARDRVGIKPLFYAPLPCGGLAFASELTALLAHGGVEFEVDPRSLSSLFLKDHVDAPHSIVAGVRKLEPGRFVQWVDGRLAAGVFWSLDEVQARRGDESADALAARLRSLLESSVQTQLIADVPIGVFLSGGIDSSIVAALAAKECPRLRTFSIGFDDAAYDESEHARRVAAAIGSSHVERRFGETDLLAVLDRALDSLDEPIGDPSILPTFLLSALAAEHVKVALGGDGGDELWAGYPTYRAHGAAWAYGLVPEWARRGIVKPLVGALPVRHTYQPLEWKAKRFVERFHRGAARRHVDWMSGVAWDELHDVCAAASYEPAKRPSSRDGDGLNSILRMDFESYLPGSVLTKVDRTAMAHGLEVRPPLLHNELIDFAFGLPSRFKLHRGTSKRLLKMAARGLVPDVILDRRKKGFGVPLARWMAGPLRDRLENVLRDSPLWMLESLRRDRFRRMADEHVAMRRDHSKPLWTLITLDHWFRRASAVVSAARQSNFSGASPFGRVFQRR